MEAASYGMMYGMAALFMAVYYVIALAACVLQYVAWWKIFVKAGEPGWKCLIPFYNNHTIYKLVWKPVYYWLTLAFGVAVVVLMMVWTVVAASLEQLPVAFTAVTWGIWLAYLVVAAVWSVKLCVKLSRRFGHGGAFAAGLVFLPVVFLLILAFGKDVYQGGPSAQPQPEAQNFEPWQQNEP